MTHGRYAVGREEATPETATGDRASRQRNRGLNLCENFLEHISIHGRQIPGNQLAACAYLRVYGLASSTHVE